MYPARFIHGLLVLLALCTAVFATPTRPPPAKRSSTACSTDCPTPPDGYYLYNGVGDDGPFSPGVPTPKDPYFRCAFVSGNPIESLYYCYYDILTGTGAAVNNIICPKNDANSGACDDTMKRRRGYQERFPIFDPLWEPSDDEDMEDVSQPW